MNTDPFAEYIKFTEPEKNLRAGLWNTAIGLQAVDGLKPSKYLIETAAQNINGDISIETVQTLIQNYYMSIPGQEINEEEKEADIVSARITKLISEPAFSFSPSHYQGIHKTLFQGIYKYAGKLRDYNITKKEWVLNGDTVMYGSASELKDTLEYDFATEKKFSYKGLTVEETIEHLAVFISRLWQIHVFPEGNTRTTAVFLIKYLRTLGYIVSNDTFANNSWYFRNALVRANYTNVDKNVHETTKYLVKFLRNLLMGENNKLSNRLLHIHSKIYFEKQDIKPKVSDIQSEVSDIQSEVSDIQSKKQDIRTQKNVTILCENMGTEFFGRADVMEILDMSASAASSFIKKMLNLGFISPISGHGKGKYVLNIKRATKD